MKKTEPVSRVLILTDALISLGKGKKSTSYCFALVGFSSSGSEDNVSISIHVR